MTLTAPTTKIVRTAVAQYEADQRNALADRTLRLLFEAHPQNIDEAYVLQKVATLNALYSTQIYDVIAVAQHIVALDIDSLLAAGSFEVVPKIATVRFKSAIRINYSFATKYCSWHNAEAFPIFDDNVKKRLLAYQAAFNFATFSAYTLKDYSEFVSVLKAFAATFGLSELPLREIDKFLWLEGKRSGA